MPLGDRGERPPPVNTSPPVPPRLVVEGLRKAYGGRLVVDGVGFTVGAGRIHGLRGPKGAGKTTVFRLVAGVERPDAGHISLDGVALIHEPLHRRARMGLAYLPQEDTLFGGLTVADNVDIAVEVARSTATTVELLETVGLAALAAQPVGGLSGGERRRLQVARLLALAPRLLLLDEPFAGVDPIAVGALVHLVRAIAARGVAVLVTDHSVREALSMCDRVTLVDGGTVQVEGTPFEIAADARARSRYLGADFVLAPPLQEGR